MVANSAIKFKMKICKKYVFSPSMGCSVSLSCVMMMCDIFFDSLDMYLDVVKMFLIIRILPDEIFLVKVKHCSPQGKFPLGQKITAYFTT
jgi:hypothetical protein